MKDQKIPRAALSTKPNSKIPGHRRLTPQLSRLGSYEGAFRRLKVVRMAAKAVKGVIKGFFKHLGLPRLIHTNNTRGSNPLASVNQQVLTVGKSNPLRFLLAGIGLVILSQPALGCGDDANPWLMLAAPSQIATNEGQAMLNQRLMQWQPGSVLLLEGHLKHLRSEQELKRFLLQIKSYRDVLIAVDQEGGRIQAIGPRQGFFAIPAMDLLGRLNDPKATERLARMVGQKLRQVGIDWNLAPVADLAAAGNPVITGLKRGFSADPQVVATHVKAFVSGLSEAGVISTLKHFPGHGRTLVDSHRSRVYLPHTLHDMETHDWPPFVDSLAVADSVMMGHLDAPKICGAVPASLSSCFINKLLRQQLGYGGIVITDGFGMAAITESFSVETASVKAIESGNDVVMVTFDQAAAVVKAVCDRQNQDPQFANLLKIAAERFEILKRRHSSQRHSLISEAVDEYWIRSLLQKANTRRWAH